MRTANKLEDIWKHNNLLVAKKSPHKLHFVCLEGSCGTGKVDLLRRLERQGFRTVLHRYYDHALEMRCTTGSSTSATQAAHQIHQHLKQGGVHGIRGQGAFMAQPLPLLSAHLWAAKLIDALRGHTRAKAEGVAYKENTVFVHRSLLTPVIYGVEHYSDLFDEIRHEFNISLVGCYTDPIRQAERVGERLYWADGLEKEIRMELENEDKVRLTNELYELYEKRNYFDAMLPTTSTKQAQVHLLSMCGIEFDPDNIFAGLHE